MKTRYDSGATGHHFKEGDQVWMYNPKRWRGLCPKLQQNWEGPYTIVKKLNDVIYRVQRSPNAKPKVINASLMVGKRVLQGEAWSDLSDSYGTHDLGDHFGDK
ncbi:hypothetical protein AVEN_195919-1 [Araneus ventricosus]|uniref:Integrase p58-like C-terminal domain-containing protein n=1 Tax=Araneus ventricosus TaxID=182803 RepID=A0A4Y2RLN3_ARAVE|nr:hypothetical protein AVEN_195919-1 [Araneus ventricosus]